MADATMYECESCLKMFCNLESFGSHDCCTATVKDQSLNTDQLQPGNDHATWNHAGTLLLITSYKENSRERMKKKALWTLLAEEMHLKYKYTYTPSQIENKWKSLMNAYRTTKDRNRKTGSGRSQFQYTSQLDEIFVLNHDTQPTFLMGSGISVTGSTPSVSRSNSPNAFKEEDINMASTSSKKPINEIECSDSSSGDEAKCTSKQQPEKKKRRSRASNGQTSQVLSFLERFSDKQAELEETRKKLSTKQQSEKVDVLRNLIEVLKK